VLKNAISEEVAAAEKKGCTFEDIKHLVAGSRGRRALQGGDVDDGVITASQIVGLIDDIPTCAELIQRMMAEFRERWQIVQLQLN
jgi:nitronate monooxygenase